MPRGKNTTKPASDETHGEEDDGEAKGPKEPTIIIDDLKTIGIGPGGGGYVTLFKRIYYAERTVTSSPRWGERVYEAGSHGPWKAVSWPSGKYPIVNALRSIANELMDSELDSAINRGGDVDLLVDRLEKRIGEFESRMIQHFGNMKL